MLAVCNKGCNKQFELNDLKERKVKNDIIEVYFECPFCSKKYICCFTNRTVRLKQYRLNNLWAKYRAAETTEKQRSIFKSIEKLKVEIKNDMNALKIKVLGIKE